MFFSKIIDTYGCWEDYIRLQFNRTTGESRPYPGVHTRIPGWGTTETIEYVDPSWLTFLAGNTGAYFSTFVRSKYTYIIYMRRFRFPVLEWMRN